MRDVTTRGLKGETFRHLVLGLLTALEAVLDSIVDRELRVTPGGRARPVNAADFLSSVKQPMAVVRGALDGRLAGHEVLIAFDLVEAITLSACMMMTSEDVIREQRQNGWFAKEHAEAFAEVGNVVCSGIAGVFREFVDGTANLRIRDVGMLHPGFDESGVLPGEPLVVYDFGLKIADYPESRVHLILSESTARAFRYFERQPAAEVQATPPLQEGEPQRTAEPDAGDPVNGHLAAFCTNQDTAAAIRECGRRLGVEVHRHPRTDIPNPAAHRGQVVLIEIPLGEDKRFEWAKRIKLHQPEIPVVLLIHEPSRARVVQGFMTKSDVIVAWPSREEHLIAKVSPLLAAAGREAKD